MARRVIKLTITLVVDGCQDVFVDVQDGSKVARTYNVANDEAVDQFLRETTNSQTDARILSKDLFETYQQWCIDGGQMPLDRRSFGIQIKKRGYLRSRDNRGRFQWRGLSIHGE